MSGGRDIHPLCDPQVSLKTKLEACIRVWNQLHETPILGSITTSEAEWSVISNKCEPRKVIFKGYNFPAEEENMFHCHLSVLKFDTGLVEKEEEFYLAQGVVSQPDSVFVMIEAKYDESVTKTKLLEKKKYRKKMPLTIQELLPEIGMVDPLKWC